MQPVISAFEQHINQLIDTAADRILTSQHPFYARLPRAALRAGIGGAFQAVLNDLRHNTNSAFSDYLAQSGEERASQGATPSDIISGFNVGINTTSDFFRTHFNGDAQALMWWFERIHQITQDATMRLSDVMILARERRIQEQASIIRELSTPILPIYENVLVVPLVGAVDSQRAAQITENLLQSITTHQADIVLLDITGVPIVDTGVAHYILQAAKAVRLLGAEIVLVGVRAEIAQTLVQLGVSLSDLTTHANLQAGIAYATQRLVARG